MDKDLSVRKYVPLLESVHSGVHEMLPTIRVFHVSYFSHFILKSRGIHGLGIEQTNVLAVSLVITSADVS